MVEFIDKHREVSGVESICEVLPIAPSTYYEQAARRREPALRADRAKRDEVLLPEIKRVHFASHGGVYGAEKVWRQLGREGIVAARCTVERLMRAAGLRGVTRGRAFTVTTESCELAARAPDLVNRAFRASRPNQLWVADITYIPLRTAGFAYLALVMDRFSRRVVGWQLANHMSESLVCQALRSAIRTRQPRAGLIHHSDRGGQYAGGEYRSLMRRTEMRQSMSRARNCYDNAFMESCFGTIKTELEMTEYDDIAGARRELASYLSYYNLERRHSSLDYLSPAAFEQLHTPPG